MELALLKLSWSDFHRKIEEYEEQKERELREKNPSLTEFELSNKVRKATDRKFREHANILLSKHLALTKSQEKASRWMDSERFKY